MSLCSACVCSITARSVSPSHDGFALGLAGEHDARRGGEVALDVTQQLGAVHAGHAHVGDHDVRGSFLHLLERLLAAEREGHVPAFALLAQTVAEAVENGLFVVDKEHVERRSVHAAACLGVEMGSRT
jgi:hypothetical protein